MSARIISHMQAVCDGCSRLFPAPDQDDDTEYRAEATAVSGGWVRDGADVCCPGCAAMPASMRPTSARRMQRGARPGVGV